MQHLNRYLKDDSVVVSDAGSAYYVVLNLYLLLKIKDILLQEHKEIWVIHCPQQ